MLRRGRTDLVVQYSSVGHRRLTLPSRPHLGSRFPFRSVCRERPKEISSTLAPAKMCGPQHVGAHLRSRMHALLGTVSDSLL